MSHKVVIHESVTHRLMLSWGYKFLCSTALRDVYTDGYQIVEVVFGLVAEIRADPDREKGI